MSAPLAYQRSCVPVALGTLLDDPPERLAELLWRGGAARPLPRGVGGEAGGWGTVTSLALDLLHFHQGARAQRWNPDGTLSLSAREIEHLALLSAHRHSLEVTRPGPPPAPEPRMVRLVPEDAPAGDPPPLLTVRGWQSRFPFGRWMVTVPAGDGNTHALGVRDGEIVAGGLSYTSFPVLEAHRLLLPDAKV